jgi:hypothetical protein
MPLNLYRRHQRGCEAGHPVESRTCEFDERSAGSVVNAPYSLQERLTALLGARTPVMPHGILPPRLPAFRLSPGRTAEIARLRRRSVCSVNCDAETKPAVSRNRRQHARGCRWSGRRGSRSNCECRVGLTSPTRGHQAGPVAHGQPRLKAGRFSGDRDPDALPPRAD